MPDTYIEEVMYARTNIVVYTINGYQIRGCVVNNDEDYIVVLSSGKKKMIYKHAISTIEPV